MKWLCYGMGFQIRKRGWPIALSDLEKFDNHFKSHLKSMQSAAYLLKGNSLFVLLLVETARVAEKIWQDCQRKREED